MLCASISKLDHRAFLGLLLEVPYDPHYMSRPVVSSLHGDVQLLLVAESHLLRHYCTVQASLRRNKIGPHGQHEFVSLMRFSEFTCQYRTPWKMVSSVLNV